MRDSEFAASVDSLVADHHFTDLQVYDDASFTNRSAAFSSLGLHLPAALTSKPGIHLVEETKAIRIYCLWL